MKFMRYNENFQPIQPYIPPNAGYDLAGQQPYQPSPEERRMKTQASLTNAQAKLAEQYGKRNGSIAWTVIAVVFCLLLLVGLCYYLFGETAAMVVLGFILIAGYDTLKNSQSVALFRATLDTVANFQRQDAATDKARYSAFSSEARLQAQQLRMEKEQYAQLPTEEYEVGEWGTVRGDDE